MALNTIVEAKVYRSSDDLQMSGVTLDDPNEEVRLNLADFEDGEYYLYLLDVNGLTNDLYVFTLTLRDKPPFFV